MAALPKVVNTETDLSPLPVQQPRAALAERLAVVPSVLWLKLLHILGRRHGSIRGEPASMPAINSPRLSLGSSPSDWRRRPLHCSRRKRRCLRRSANFAIQAGTNPSTRNSGMKISVALIAQSMKFAAYGLKKASASGS